jgi:hypothetical protein
MIHQELIIVLKKLKREINIWEIFQIFYWRSKMTKTDIERILEDPELHPDFRKDLELQLSEIINNENFEKLYGNKINSIKDIIENSEAKNKVGYTLFLLTAIIPKLMEYKGLEETTKDIENTLEGLSVNDAREVLSFVYTKLLRGQLRDGLEELE